MDVQYLNQILIIQCLLKILLWALDSIFLPPARPHSLIQSPTRVCAVVTRVAARSLIKHDRWVSAIISCRTTFRTDE